MSKVSVSNGIGKNSNNTTIFVKVQIQFSIILYCIWWENIMNNISELFIDNNVITKVHSSKFLGIIIDEKLKWQDYINAVANKVSKSLGVIYKMKNALPVTILPMLYSTAVLYCRIISSAIWYGLVIILLIYINSQFSKRELYVLLVQLSLGLMQLIFLKDINS